MSRDSQVDSARKASTTVGQELESLQGTLKDIESARSFDELTTGDVAKARPQLTKTTEALLKNGRWSIPGYSERFGNLSAT